MIVGNPMMLERTSDDLVCFVGQGGENMEDPSITPMFLFLLTRLYLGYVESSTIENSNAK